MQGKNIFSGLTWNFVNLSVYCTTLPLQGGYIILVVFALQEPAIDKYIQQEEMGIVDVNNYYTGEHEWQV